MSRKSATETIKKLNPQNISGTVPQALDLIKSLKEVKGNPKMIEAVGIKNLQGMLKHLMELFKKPKNKQTDDDKKKEEETLKTLEELQVESDKVTHT